jgi:Glycosyltransferase family 92
VKPYFTVCTMYRNHAQYLREWIEFHRLVGAEHFFLYDNRSEDDHREVLDPYIDAGLVTLHDWPPDPGLRQAFDHCVTEHRDDARWIAFIDIDEFLFSPSGEPVSEILRDYEDAPAVAVNWLIFGTSGHKTPPPGLVTENYTFRTNSPSNNFIKSIVDPARTVRCVTPHAFIYEDGVAVNENHEPLPARAGKSPSPSWSRLRINHYVTKSEQEWQAKLNGVEPFFGWKRQDHTPGVVNRSFNDEADVAIQIYVPRLRDAVAGSAPA